MTTTIICTASPIGLGIMACEIARNVRSVDSAIIIDYPQYTSTLNLQGIQVLNRIELGDQEKLKPLLRSLSSDPKRKFLYLETSWGLSRYTPRARNYYIPMWEQHSWLEESNYCDNFISITKHGLKIFSSEGIYSRFLPFPVTTRNHVEPRKKIETILHNAGSFGGNFRKGTPEAIRIFQESNLGYEGISLVVSSIIPPSKELIEVVNINPRGISFDPKIKDDWQENYSFKDLLLFPSRIEGHALAILEAASLGIPSLCSDVSPINEYESDSDFLIPTHKMSNGRVEVKISEAASLLRNLFNLDWEKKSLAVMNNVMENYSWATLGGYYEEILK